MDVAGDLRESPLRSLLKAITYRAGGTTTTAAVAWFITGDASSAIAISGLELIFKILFYYLHERAWQMVPLGSIRRLLRRGPRVQSG